MPYAIILGESPTTDRSVSHATFVIERIYGASPARVFAAFADPAAHDRWFAKSDYPKRLMERPSFARAVEEARPFFELFPG